MGCEGVYTSFDGGDGSLCYCKRFVVMTANERLMAAEAETREEASYAYARGQDWDHIATCCHIALPGAVVIVTYQPTRGWDYAFAETPDGLWGTFPTREMVLLAIECRLEGVRA